MPDPQTQAQPQAERAPVSRHGRLNRACAIVWLLAGVCGSEFVLGRLISRDNQFDPLNLLVLRTVSVSLLTWAGVTFAWRRRIALTRANLVVTGLVVGLGVVEAGLRIVPAVRAFRHQMREAELRMPHARLHHALRPSVRGTATWGGIRVEYATNSLGFRDRNVRDVAKTTTSDDRVLLLGDSFTEGVGIPFDKTFAGLLPDALRAHGDDVEVLNGGNAGYFPRLYRRRLDDFLAAGFATDVVVVLLDVTDVHDAAVRYRDWDCFSGAEVASMESERASRAWKGIWNEEMGSLYQALYPRLVRRLRDWRTPPAGDPWAWLADRETCAWTEARFRDRDWVAQGVRLCQTELAEIQEQCARSGAAMLLVIFPEPTQLASARSSNVHRESFAEFADSRDLTFVDLYPVFGALTDWRTHFIRGDNHWNEAGHQLVAQTLCEALAPVVSGIKTEEGAP